MKGHGEGRVGMKGYSDTNSAEEGFGKGASGGGLGEENLGGDGADGSANKSSREGDYSKGYGTGSGVEVAGKGPSARTVSAAMARTASARKASARRITARAIAAIAWAPMPARRAPARAWAAPWAPRSLMAPIRSLMPCQACPTTSSTRPSRTCGPWACSSTTARP